MTTEIKTGLNGQGSDQQRGTCPQCKADVRKTANFCKICGIQLKTNPVVVFYNQ